MVKVACTVRGGMFGKVPLDGNSLGIYSTQGVLEEGHLGRYPYLNCLFPT